MTILSRLLGWMLKLPPAVTRDVVVNRDIPVPMPDGAILLADHYQPRLSASLALSARASAPADSAAPRPAPTILIRSPYGRAGIWGIMFGRPFAERGFQVFIQSCRGTFGSTGEFRPFVDDRADGLATLDWLERQPWYRGPLAMFGASYLGIAQWAIAPDAGERLGAMSCQLTTAHLPSAIYPGGSFWLDAALMWAGIVESQERGFLRSMLAVNQAPRLLAKAAKQLPLRTADELMVGKPLRYYREWADHSGPSDPFWEPVDFSARTGEITAPLLLLGGWYDVFLPQVIADHLRMKRAGKTTHLTIGPWPHFNNGWLAVALQESIAWYRAHLLGDRAALREQPVRVFVMGAGEWRDFPEWPPPGMHPERFYLQPGGGLSTELPPTSEPDRYRYDPDDPTPSIGGSALSPNSGAKDNKPLLSRADVLVYTGAPLPRDTEIIGPVSAELFVESSLPHTDFFVRLCDAAPSGKTLNVCDGLLRLTPDNPPTDERGRRKVTIELWPTAYRFKRGHQIRVLVASGAHPRYARNPGSGEPLATATTLVAADQAIHHDPPSPSAVVLPIWPASPAR